MDIRIRKIIRKIKNKICPFCNSEMSCDLASTFYDRLCNKCNIRYISHIFGKGYYYSHEVIINNIKYSIHWDFLDDLIRIYTVRKGSPPYVVYSRDKIFELYSNNITPFNIKQKLLTILNFQ